MDATKYQRAVGLFYSYDETEQAVRELKYIGYDMDNVSVIARDTNQIEASQTVEDISNRADKGAAAGALTGGTLGGITGFLVGLGALAVPGMGPVFLVGVEASTIATTLAGAGIGAATGGLVGALIGLDIPEEKAKLYSDRISGGSFFVTVVGTLSEIARVSVVMGKYGVEEFNIYDISKSKVDDEFVAIADSDTSAANPSYSQATEKTIEKEGRVLEGDRKLDNIAVDPNAVGFTNSEVARIEIYEESNDIQKQAFVREQVKIYKQVEHDTIKAEEILRREELDIDIEKDTV